MIFFIHKKIGLNSADSIIRVRKKIPAFCFNRYDIRIICNGDDKYTLVNGDYT